MSATSNDHNAITTNITYGKCSRRECTNITVFDDMSLEHEEIFTLSLSLVHGQGQILLDVVEKVVTITDTDSKALFSHVSVNLFAADITISLEPGVTVEGYAMEIYLYIDGASITTCPSSAPLRVILQTYDGTASKFCKSRHYLTFFFQSCWFGL